MKKTALLTLLLTWICALAMGQQRDIYPELQARLQTQSQQFAQIPQERKEALAQLAQYVQQQVQAGKPVELIFICTHNSRRSHISQLWAQVAAAYYGIPSVRTYSGGTEATAFNPRAVRAMQAMGFRIAQVKEGDNPRYEVRYAASAPAVEAFSKKYSSPSNPQKGFGAVMVCSQADEACPAVLGADFRLALPYIDPKVSDNTDKEQATYLERAEQIGREMLYAFSLVKVQH